MRCCTKHCGIETCTGYTLKLCLKKRKKVEKKGGNKGRDTAERQLEAGPGLPETELGLSLVQMGKACNYFILFFEAEDSFFSPLRTVLLELKRNTRRQPSWRSQRKTVQALASIERQGKNMEDGKARLFLTNSEKQEAYPGP